MTLNFHILTPNPFTYGSKCFKTDFYETRGVEIECKENISLQGNVQFVSRLLHSLSSAVRVNN